jgi:hypothetical protein
MINQVFIYISLPKNTDSKKIYKYKFSETQAHFSEGPLGVALARLSSLGIRTQRNEHPLRGMPKGMTLLP